MEQKKRYEAPVMEVKGFAQLENVYTYCDNNGGGCVNVTGTYNASDKNGNVGSSHSQIPYLGGGSTDSGSGLGPA